MVVLGLILLFLGRCQLKQPNGQAAMVSLRLVFSAPSKNGFQQAIRFELKSKSTNFPRYGNPKETHANQRLAKPNAPKHEFAKTHFLPTFARFAALAFKLSKSKSID
ncbi:MAG: hypothetical protein IAB08_03840 [Bacteroidetes bacterium]|uniref:Uncharacterized protein n=1 Tax=Candidatus Pullibacteroides excrementavium TaxID=2840905 RepID=A0A9D9H104_9BACT|nr:hypothetical protein [Candidatus Pullibacteroides excrementavium]